jgi:hypothetical protein
LFINEKIGNEINMKGRAKFGMEEMGLLSITRVRFMKTYFEHIMISLRDMFCALTSADVRYWF